MAAKRDPWLTLIGVGKLLKVLALVAIGVTALRFSAEHADAGEKLRHLAFSLGLNPGSKLVDAALVRAGVLDEKTLETIGVVTFVYAALFAVEATGLLLQKKWGEWVTIAITGSFIPLEVYETARHPHAGRAVTIVLNVAVVAYLVWRVCVKERRSPMRAALSR